MKVGMGLAVRDGGEAVPGATPDETGDEVTGLPDGAMAAAVEEVSGKVKLVPGAMGVAKVVVSVLTVTTAAAAVLLLLEVSGTAALEECVSGEASKEG